jgi:hypothetical protein
VFKRIDIKVIATQDGIAFQFAEPLSITSVTVACPATEEIHWELISDGFEPVEVSESSFQMWPIEQAPAWALQALEEVSAREAARLESQGPRLPARETLSYGEVPPGYREDLLATVLTPGSYTLIVFAEQGTASTLFEVPAV